jgi:hypothetical protein
VPVTTPTTKPIGTTIETPLPIFEAVLAFSPWSTRMSPSAVGQLIGIACAAFRVFLFLHCAAAEHRRQTKSTQSGAHCG